MACTATAVRPIEYLDEATAATVTVVAQPLVFARARPELSISARDYASIVALSVNRAGRVEHLLLAHVWSTIDPRVHPADAASPGPLLLLADGRPIRFERDARTPREAGVSGRTAGPRWRVFSTRPGPAERTPSGRATARIMPRRALQGTGAGCGALLQLVGM